MSHVEHTDVVIDRLVAIWDEGLTRKFPHYRMHSTASGPATFTRTMSLSSTRASAGDETLTGKISSPGDWPISEAEIAEKLHEVIRNRMDRWSLASLKARLRQPGRLLIAPTMMLPVLIIQLRKVLRGELSRKERGLEAGLLLYIFVLIFVVQEVTRDEG